MPDRVLQSNEVAFYADLPGATGSVTATLTNPAGTVIASGIPAGAVSGSDDRYQVNYFGSALTMHGVWKITWTDATYGAREPIPFTVGPAGGINLWTLRLMVAAREDEVIEGEITDLSGTTVTDLELLNPASYKGRWFMVAPRSNPITGLNHWAKAKRVRDFSGSALILSSPYAGTEPVSGDRYALLKVDPKEIDRALKIAFDEMKTRARVPITQAGLALAATATDNYWQVTLPAELTRVDTVWLTSVADDDEYNGKRLFDRVWRLEPGRKLIIGPDSVLAAGDTITISGTRDLSFPLDEISTLDIEPTALVSRAAIELMATRSSGAALDQKEHLRRFVMAQQEFEQAVGTSAGRVPNGSRAVIP